MNSHPLKQLLADLRRQVRRLTTLRGVAMVAVALLSTVIVLGGIDYVVRFQDPGVLLIFELAVFTVAVWTIFRYLYLPWQRPWTDADLALRVQERLPDLGDGLASAVAFLDQAEDDPLAGSADLRRAVISATTAATEKLDFKQVLDSGPARRWAIGATALGIFAALLVIANPTSSSIAMTRLVAPLSGAAWPRSSHLRLSQPAGPIGRGQAFVVEVVDAQGAPLPDNVKIHYRPLAATDKAGQDVEKMQVVGNVAAARREHVTQSFQFYIDGGDSRPIDWTDVPVLEPPEIASLKIHRQPPAYSRLPAGDDDGALSLTVLAGTHLTLTGTSSKPLAAAWLVRDGQPDLPATIDPKNMQSLRVELTAQQSAQMWFKLNDVDHLIGGNATHWDLRVVADAPPKVTIDKPAGNLSVTSSALVPVRVTALEDILLQQVALTGTVLAGSKSYEQRQVLYVARSDSTEHVDAAQADVSAPNPGDRRTLDAEFDLAKLSPHVAPGAQVRLIASASDFLPQTGTSEPRVLTIITPEELLERISARQNLLLAEVARLLTIQREAHERVRLSEIRVHEKGRLSQAEVDSLQACEMNQRDVARSLSPLGDGLASHILALLADLEMNRVDSPESHNRLKEQLDEIAGLTRNHLPPLAQSLTSAVKSAQTTLDPDAAPSRDMATEKLLGETLTHQQAVIASLQGMLDRLRQWDDYQRLCLDISHLLRDQVALGQAALALGTTTLTKDLKDLTPTELAELKVMAEKQSELARQLDRLEGEMERTSAVLRERNAPAADSLIDAGAESRKASIAATMRHAAEGLLANRIGRASEDQANVAEKLQTVLDVLGGGRNASLARKANQLQSAIDDIGFLKRRQAETRQAIERASAEGDPSRRQSGLERAKRDQEELRAAAKELARRLMRLGAKEAADQMNEAADAMAKSGESAQHGARQQAAADAQAAEKAIADAERRAAKTLDRLKAELLFEQMARLEDSLKHLSAQEQHILADTREFDRLKQLAPLTDAQHSGLHDTAQLQADVLKDVAQSLEATEPESVFHLALTQVNDEMGRAAAALQRLETGVATQQLEQSAIDRIGRILEALAPEKDAPKSDGPNDEKPPGERPPGDEMATLSALKLLKLMQEDINRRTAALNKAIVGGQDITAEAQAEFARLSDEQGHLAALALKFLSSAKNEPHPDAPEMPQEEP